MSALLDVIRPAAVTIVYGAPGQCQALIAEEIAFRAARSGRRVAVLVDGPGGESQLRERQIAWRARKNVDVGERMQITPINEHDFDRVQDVGTALLQKLRDLDLRPHLVVFTSPAFEPQGIDSAVGQRVLDAARMVASAPGIASLVAGHIGPVPGATCTIPDASLWRCDSGLNLTVTLAGPAGQEIKIRGWEIGRGAVSFEEPIEEPVS